MNKRCLQIAIAMLCITVIKVQSIAQSNTILWQVNDSNNKKIAFLFFTTNTCEAKITLPNKVTNALNEAEGIVIDNFNSFNKDSVVVFQQPLLKVEDSMRLKNILDKLQYETFIEKAMNEGASKEQAETFNNFHFAQLMNIFEKDASPCISSNTIQDHAMFFNEYAAKISKPISFAYSISFIHNNWILYTKSYVQKQLWYAFKYKDALSSTVIKKNELYKQQDINGLKALYSSDLFYKNKFNLDILESQVNLFCNRIATQSRQGIVFYSLNISNMLYDKYNIHIALQKMGFKVKPIF